MSSNARRMIFIPVFVLLGIGAFLYSFKRAKDDKSATVEQPKAEGGDTPKSIDKQTKAPVVQKKGIPKWRMSEEDKKRRAELLQAVLLAINTRIKEPNKPREISLSQDGGLPSDREVMEYIRAPILEIRGLLRECYGNALELEPDLSGVLMVRFVIAVDREAGALIESSELVDGEGHIQDSELGECIQETMYALRFKKPRGTGRIIITYPMVLTTSQKSIGLESMNLKPKIEVAGWTTH